MATNYENCAAQKQEVFYQAGKMVTERLVNRQVWRSATITAQCRRGSAARVTELKLKAYSAAIAVGKT
jgi:hypothetical protein